MNGFSVKRSEEVRRWLDKTCKALWNKESILAYSHCRIRTQTRIQTPNPIATQYYSELFTLVQTPTQMVSQMVTVPILGTDLCPYYTHFNQRIRV